MRILGTLTVGIVMGLTTVTVGCASTDNATSPSPSAQAPAPKAAPSPKRAKNERFAGRVNVSGWEGFYPGAQLDTVFLAKRGIPVSLKRLAAVAPRTIKLVLDGGEQTAPEADLIAQEAATCSDPRVAQWNEDRCAGLKARRCTDGTCQYAHFGNCSGFLLGEGRLLTAAHCVADLVADDARRATSAALRPNGAAVPARMALGAITVGKSDFSHDWVNVASPDAMDVALIKIDDGGLAPYPIAAVPQAGAVLFVHGYPRVEGRTEADRRDHGYNLVAGTPTYSFGRVAHRNVAGAPLCSTDGIQSHWQLSAPCPAEAVTVDGAAVWTGPISARPFLATYDTSNGYSGAPVFDGSGRLVGVNATLLSPHSPQERYSTLMMQVASPAALALETLVP